MKILLVNPPILIDRSRRQIEAVIENLFYNSPPLGLAYIAAVLEKEGHDVAIIDAAVEKLSLDQAADRAASFAPGVLGLTSTTNLFDCAVALGKRLKERLGDVPLLLGGPHVSVNPEHALSHACFDVGVLGEGERTMAEAAAALSAGRGLEGVSGLVLRRNGGLVPTPFREPIQNLDELPFPARHLLPMRLYRPQPNDQYLLPKVSMIAGRGCPYSCIFCDKSVFNGPYRSFSAGYIVSEMEHLIKAYGARDIAFLDSIFTISAARVEGIIDEMKRRGVRVAWTCTARANVVTEELLRKMKEAGCWRIRLGIESGNDSVLKFIRKGITTQQVRDAARWANALGIQTKGFFMIGHLIDTRQTVEETIRFARSLPLKDITVQINTPMHKTPQWEISKEHGRFLSVAYKDFSYWQPVFIPNGLTKEYLLEAHGRFYRSFYMRPITAWRHLCHLRHAYNVFKYPRAFRLLRHLFFRQRGGRRQISVTGSRGQTPRRQTPVGQEARGD